MGQPAQEEESKSCVRVTAAGLIYIGEKCLDRAHLETTWSGWDEVLSAVKDLPGGLTQQELALLNDIPKTNGARNGFQEFRQAANQRGLLHILDVLPVKSGP